MTIDTRVLLYVAGLSVLTGLVAGLAPSVIVARRSIVESLHAGTSRVTHAPRIRQLLIVGQVAMTVVLLCATAALAEPRMERMDLFEAGRDRYKIFRIPGVVVTAKGTVLAYCEARKTGSDWGEIDILLRRIRFKGDLGVGAGDPAASVPRSA